MRIYVSFDMEGVAGVVDWAQCRPTGGVAYEHGRDLLLGEVNAAVQGALDGGADEVVLNDAHGAMANLDPARLHPATSYLSGRHKPDYMMQGLDASFGAVFFVGYHGSISGPPSVLSHTYNPEAISRVRLNGSDVGESGINALVAHRHGVPIALVTGDDVTREQAVPICPDATFVVTKHSVTRFAARSVHPQRARDLIRAGAEHAVRGVAANRVRPPHVDMPATMEVEVHTADMADVASWVKGVERSGTRSVTITGKDGAVMYRAFVGLTYITRQAGGR